MNGSNSMRAREQQATFHEWLRAHRAVFLKIVRAYAFTPADRDDLFQEIATRVWRSIPGYRGKCAVTKWIYRVALNCALSWKRGERKHREGRQPLDGIELALQEDPSAANFRLEWLYEQIRRLNDIDRSLALLMLDGFSYKDMAATLGISESNVGVRINRIKAQLVARLGGESRHEL